MWANAIISVAVRVIVVPLNIASIVSGIILAVLALIPPMGLLLGALMDIVWLVFDYLLIGTAWIWHRGPSGVRSIASLAGVPLALLSYIYLGAFTWGDGSLYMAAMGRL